MCAWFLAGSILDLVSLDDEVFKVNGLLGNFETLLLLKKQILMFVQQVVTTNSNILQLGTSSSDEQRKKVDD